MKWFKFLMMCLIQVPVATLYYLDPMNPIYLIVWLFGLTMFVFMMDNAISNNYNNIHIMESNFTELLEKIVKAVPKNPRASKHMEEEEE